MFDRLGSSPQKYIKKTLLAYKKLDKVSIAGFLVMAQLFIVLSAPHIWNDDEIYRMFMLYFVMMAFSFTLLGSFNPFYKISLFDGVMQMSLALVGGIVLFSQFGFVLPHGSESFGGFESLTLLIVAQALVVGVIEELMFRGSIPRALDRSNVSPYASRLFSNIAFAGFHVWAYDFSYPALIGAFCFGIIMQYLWDGGKIPSVNKDRVSNKVTGYPLFACGLHAAWNVVILTGNMSVWVWSSGGGI